MNMAQFETVDKFRLAQIMHAFETRMLEARDRLEPIVSGEIERAHCSPGTRECYGGRPGMRKTMLKDAVSIARTVTAIIDNAVNRFHEDQKELGV